MKVRKQLGEDSELPAEQHMMNFKTARSSTVRKRDVD